MSAATDPSTAARILGRGPDFLRKQMELEGPGCKAGVGPSAAQRLAASRAQYVRGSQEGSGAKPDPNTQDPNPPDSKPQDSPTPGTPGTPGHPRKQRLDSLLIYRHRGEKGSTGRRLTSKSLKDSGGLDPNPKSQNGVCRSHSDISSRYSRHPADLEASFFTYCGLDEDVVASLGPHNFGAAPEGCDRGQAMVRSVSTATSEPEQDRASHASNASLEGKEEEGEQRGPGSSAVERNARVIKWLYSCRNASEAGKALRELH